MLYDKGVADFVKAIELIEQNEIIKYRFVLVGNIDIENPNHVPEEIVRAWVANGLIEWWGFSNNIIDIYNIADIIILPSYREGLSTTLIEAAACGLPIVTTDIPGCRDVVIDGYNGYLIPPYNPKAIAKALERLIVDGNLRSEFGKNSRMIAKEKFSKEKIINEIIDIYLKI